MQVTLCGWIQRNRNLGSLIFIDLRDRFGITQLSFNEITNPDLYKQANKLGREFVIKVTGRVIERESKNPNLPTGDIEIYVEHLEILNSASIPPFTIEDNTDGGEEIRMKYRYLDLRRPPCQHNIHLRHTLALEVRKYLDSLDFLEIETPFLIKSTPEGARDFVVPSRMHPTQFYALPQSPQTFKQILMVAGFDRYFQIVRCFRDEDLRADRQPEFTQIDCEMSFVEMEDILNVFEGMIRHLYKIILNIDLQSFKRLDYHDAINKYGSDKPDLRFEMPITDISPIVIQSDFPVFSKNEYSGSISVPGCADYSRKQLDKLTEFVQKPQVGASGLIYIKYYTNGSIKSSINKNYYNDSELLKLAHSCNANAGDLILILSGNKIKTQKALGELRLELGKCLQLRTDKNISPLWITGFPLFEKDIEANRWAPMHHPFSAPKSEDIELLESAPEKVTAMAYDMVINGIEIGGGSIRIHDRSLQMKILKLLGFTEKNAQKQFGFLMNAFEYGAPPHGGIAFGFDRLVALFGGSDSIRDYIAFPKNNAGRDLMIDSPSEISETQLNELFLRIQKAENTNSTK